MRVCVCGETEKERARECMWIFVFVSAQTDTCLDACLSKCAGVHVCIRTCLQFCIFRSMAACRDLEVCRAEV